MIAAWNAFWAARSWWSLLAIAAIAAAFWIQLGWVREDRDAWKSLAGQICAIAGTGVEAGTVQIPVEGGKTVRVAKKRGETCSDAIADLAIFKTESLKQTAEILEQARADGEALERADRSTAAAQLEARRTAAINMEKADARIGEDDRVDGDWFDAVNNVAGLR